MVLRSSLVVVLAVGLVASLTAGSGCDSKPEVDPAQQAEQVRKDLANGAARVKDEKYGEAEAMFARVLEADPEHPEGLAGMGRVRLGQKKYDEARGLLERAAAKLPEDASVHASLGEAYAKLERHTDAAKAYGAAFAADPNNGNYGIAQSHGLQKAKQWEAAEAVLREVAKVDPQAEFVYTELGNTLREQGRLDDALHAYMKALIEHVGDKKAHAGAAQVYELQNNTAKAIDEWSTYIRMDCCSEFSTNVAKKRIQALQGGEAAEAEG